MAQAAPAPSSSTGTVGSKPGGSFLADHFEKLILAAAVLAAGSYFYLGVLSEKPDHSASDADSVAGRIERETTLPHPNLQPQQRGDVHARTMRVWKPVVPEFQVRPWTGTFFTHLSPQEGVDPAYIEKTRKQNTEWFLPDLKVEAPAVEIDRVKLRWSVVPAAADRPKEIRRGDKDPEDVHPQNENRYAEFTVQRRQENRLPEGREPQWEEVARVEASKEKPYEPYEIEDQKIQPKTLYTYQVSGRADKAPFGRALVTDKTAEPAGVTTRDIWEVQLKYVLPSVGGNPERAKVEVKKFDLEHRAWLSREFDVKAGDVIGVQVVVRPEENFREYRITRHVTEVPGKGKLEIDWNTEFKIVSLEKDVRVEFRYRHVQEDGTEVIRPRMGNAHKLVYKDDQGGEHVVWSKDPSAIYDAPRKKEKEKEGGEGEEGAPQ